LYKESSIKIWRKFKNRYSLIGSICNDCNTKYYPGERICKKCNSVNINDYRYKPQAKLITWSKVYAAPTGYEETSPYIIGILELEDGERLTSQIVDVEYESLSIGMIMKPVIRKIYQDGEDGIIHYGLKFTLDDK
jgi:uncharacterized protein